MSYRNLNIHRLIGLLISIIILSSCADKIYVVKVNFKDSLVPTAPDYSNVEHWASLPDKADAADSVPIRSGLHNLQSNAAADVFFIYPTTFTHAATNPYQWNADVNDVALNKITQLGTILNQASIFNGSCRVYAPYYRQAHLYSFYSTNKEDGAQALEIAYADIKSAFEFYLKHFNQGRPIVIASHSQGSYHAERILKDYFDGKDLQKKLVVAYLVGRAIATDAFADIHPTEKSDDISVWASWNTFARNFIPHNYESIFKRSLSTNPLLWNSSEAYAPKELNHGGVGLHFTFVPHAVDAQNYQHILWINKPYVKGRVFLRTKNWHRADMNLFYMNIRENVALRIEKYQLKQKTETNSK